MDAKVEKWKLKPKVDAKVEKWELKLKVDVKAEKWKLKQKVDAKVEKWKLKLKVEVKKAELAISSNSYLLETSPKIFRWKDNQDVIISANRTGMKLPTLNRSVLAAHLYCC